MTPKAIDHFAAYKSVKEYKKHTVLRPIKKLSRGEMISTQNKKRRED
ncbi:hypothetical protein [Paenibacillus peoriae]|nr:hypothetical protein [Paenibacillus peoriae]